MPLLDVPMIYQPVGSGECGMACTSMLLQYYGQSHDYDTLRSEFVFDAFEGALTAQGGLYTPDIGTYFLKNGFAVLLVTANPLLFNVADYGGDEMAVRKALAERREFIQYGGHETVLQKMGLFLDAGGRIEVAIPSIAHVTRELDASHPLIVQNTTSHLFGPRRKMNMHFTIVRGYNDNRIYVNDPGGRERGGGQHDYPQEQWLYGVHAAAAIGADNAAFLCIHPR